MTSGTLPDFVGLIGVLIYVGTYLLLQLGLMAGQSYLFAGLNILAASLVLISLGQSFNLSAVFLEVAWIAISLVGMARLGLAALTVRFTPAEEAFLAAKFPTLSRHVARSLIRGGLWIDGEAGSLLTVEGEPVDNLIYLAHGEASVHLGDSLVGRCGAGSLIGEVTCLSGDPATATVRLVSPAHYFAIGAVRLRQLCSRNPELRHALEAGFGVDVRRKLEDSNEARRVLASGHGGRAGQ